jgi:hypothetical protein
VTRAKRRALCVSKWFDSISPAGRASPAIAEWKIRARKLTLAHSQIECSALRVEDVGDAPREAMGLNARDRETRPARRARAAP